MKEALMDLMEELDFHQVDFHIHTNRSFDPWGRQDGTITLKEVIEDATKRGLLCIALTDHWEPNTDPSIFLEERKEIDQAETELKIFLSAEVEVLDIQGNTPVDLKGHREVLEKMDYLSAAPHLGELLPNTPYSLVGRRDIPRNKRGIIDYSQRQHMNLLKNELFDVILHPYEGTMAYLFRQGYSHTISFEYIPERYLEEFAEAAAFYEKAIEINNVSLAAEKAKEKGYEGFKQGCRLFVEKLIKAGTKLVVGSDSHHRNDGWSWPGKTEEAVRIIRECGGDKKSLWLPRKRRLP